MSADPSEKRQTPPTPTVDGDPATPPIASDMQTFLPRYAFIIDDEEGICRLITLTLAALGVKSEFFHTAGEACAAIEHRRPALIFLDIALKGSDAIDVLRELGEKSYTGTVQLMSGSNQALLEDVRRASGTASTCDRPSRSRSAWRPSGRPSTACRCRARPSAPAHASRGPG